MNKCILIENHSNKIEAYLRGIIDNKFNSSEMRLIDKYAYDIYKLNIEPCFECIHCESYLFYKELLISYLRKIISKESLNFELNQWDMRNILNKIFSCYPDNNARIPSNREVFQTDNEKIYLDQNIISDYIKEKEFKNYILSLKDKDYQFIYSPSHIEEIFKIEKKENQDIFLESIREITNNVLCVLHDSSYIFAKEDPIYSLERIKLYDNSTQYIEEYRLITSIDRAKYLEKYDAKKHKDYIGNKKEKDHILNDLSDDDFDELMTYSHTTFRNKKDFKRIESDDDFRHAIYTLSHALDLLAYKIDKEERTIRSSMHDIEHLIYGSYANYFVTKDDKFRMRAHQIYKFLEIKTNILTKKEFEERFKNT